MLIIVGSATPARFFVLVKVALPLVVAFDFVLQTHRHLAHCREKKLLNEINMRFDIHNLATSIKRVCQECFICALNLRQPCGKERQNLPKQPQLIRRKLVHFQVDELQIVRKKLVAGWLISTRSLSG